MSFWLNLFGIAPSEPRQQPSAAAVSEVRIDDTDLACHLAGIRSSGQIANERTAMRNPTFNRAVSLIAGTIGRLPINLIETTPDGKIHKASGHPVQRLLRVQTNSWQSPAQFKSYMQGRALLTGDAYAYIVPGIRGPQALIPMDPARVSMRLTDAYELVFDWQQKSGGKRTLKRSEVLHLRSPWSSDGLTGEGLLSLGAAALGLARDADEAAARLMKNGAYVGGILKHPKLLSDDAARRLRRQFEDKFAGPENAGRWIVAEEGLEATPFGMTGRDAQGIEQRKYQAEEISRLTGVPRPLLMFDETSWGSGIEQLGLFFVTYCLMPWFAQWEEAIASALLTDAERDRMAVKFNEAALLRGSLKDQAEFLSKAIGGPGQGGWMVPDEAREKFDMNPLEDGKGATPAWGAVSPGGNDNATS